MPRPDWFVQREIPFESADEEAEFRDLEEIIRTAKRGTLARREAIEEMRKLRQRIIDRGRWVEPW